jgi:thioredoxin-related protein
MIIKVFGADNCAGCKTVKRVLQEKWELNDDLVVQSFDVNKHDGMEEAMTYNVRSIPTMVVEDGAGTHAYVGEKNCLQGIAAHLEA